jgi:hypothetical protein
VGPTQDLKPSTLAPYFVLAGLVHAAAVATRFDVLAAKLPDGAGLAIMLAQFPLLMLSGYFEGRLDYGDKLKSMPMWMRIDSKAVKLAFTFGFMYLVVVAAQTWNISIGPVDPTPPLTFPTAQRAMWFAMFTLGFAMLFFMAAASILIPVLRFVTYPLRQLPTLVGAVLAVGIGAGLGVFILAAVQSQEIAGFVKSVKGAIRADPALMVGVILATTLGPLLLGVLLKRKDD